MKKMLLSAACLAAILATGCGGKDDPAPTPTIDCTGSTPTYTANVKGIFDATCAVPGCHDATSKEEGYDFSSFAGAKAVVTSKKAELIGSINHTSGFEKMPKGFAKLSAANIKTITCWIENGSPQ